MARYRFDRTAGPVGLVNIYEGDPMKLLVSGVTLPYTTDELIDKPTYKFYVESTDACGSGKFLNVTPTTRAPFTTSAAAWTTKAYVPPTTATPTTRVLQTTQATTRVPSSVKLVVNVGDCLPPIANSSVSLVEVNLLFSGLNGASGRYDLRLAEYLAPGSERLLNDWYEIDLSPGNTDKQVLPATRYNFYLRDHLQPTVTFTILNVEVACNRPTTQKPTTLAPTTQAGVVEVHTYTSGTGKLRIYLTKDGKAYPTPIGLTIYGTAYGVGPNELSQVAVGNAFQGNIDSGKSETDVDFYMPGGKTFDTFSLISVNPSSYQGIRFVIKDGYNYASS